MSIKNNSKSISSLNMLLASMVVMRHNLHLTHWNVTGPNFMEIHKLLSDQYTQLLEFIDRLAEYIRTTDRFINLSVSKCVTISMIEEIKGEQMSTEDIISTFKNQFTILHKSINNIEPDTKALDNILGDIDEFVGKQAWFYKSYNIDI